MADRSTAADRSTLSGGSGDPMKRSFPGREMLAVVLAFLIVLGHAPVFAQQPSSPPPKPSPSTPSAPAPSAPPTPAASPTSAPPHSPPPNLLPPPPPPSLLPP